MGRQTREPLTSTRWIAERALSPMRRLVAADDAAKPASADSRRKILPRCVHLNEKEFELAFESLWRALYGRLANAR